jgi:undecaprenyl diphosphate synthase
MADLLRNFEGVVSPGSDEAKILENLDVDKMPNHVAIIMDGNGRWANQRGLRRVEGHRAGIDSVRDAVEYSARLQIPNLTLYAFSAENWKRPAEEVNTLWTLLRTYLRRELDTLQKHDICFRAIGRIQDLPESVRTELTRAENETRQNKMMNLVIALNYSGRLELVDAVNSLLSKGVEETVSEREITEHLYTAGLPDPDLLIRTSGEMRISNFLLWQIAYSEIYVSEVLWPDFRGPYFLEAILEFQRRERRYGGIQAPSYQKTQ